MSSVSVPRLLAFGVDNSLRLCELIFCLFSICPHSCLGFEGEWNIITPHGDVMLSCQVQQEPLILPANAFEMGTFLCGDGMEHLLGYRVSTCSPVLF